LSEAPSLRAGLSGEAELLRRDAASRRALAPALVRAGRIRDLARPDPARVPERSARIAMISNPRSHRNGTGAVSAPGQEILYRAPGTKGELEAAIADFAARRVDVIIIHGGDGTVRDVLSAARRVYSSALPKFAILPAGKTNAVAIDLGMSADVTLDRLIDAIRRDEIRERTPLEIWREDESSPAQTGFLFGAGAFVRATSLAQHTHRFGAFEGLAVGLSLVASIGQTLFGSKDRGWRAGDAMTIGGDVEMAGRFYILLCSTLDRFPLGLKPFGRLGQGMKLLAVDAPPRQMLRRVPMLLAGRQNEAMERKGYRHRAAETLEIGIESDFILDGETYPGGALTLRRGAPLRFVVA